jgi:diguanylate cyclase (GGDEF)-like protein
MSTPDTTQNEVTPLQEVRSLNILDIPEDERFDRLTRLAKRMFKVQTAFITLVDENCQWLKSCIGLPANVTFQDLSFSRHAIHDNDIFVIPDATKDERFADNPLVLNDPNIRFYAEIPLRHLDNSKLGTLCIIDTKPGELDEDDLEAFKDLAELIEHELITTQLATLDDLTRISNRRGFITIAQHSLDICARQAISATLVFFDLNNFKTVNDKFGHAEGDKMLKVFADQMRNAFRDSDLFARLGSDEFVVLLTNTSAESTGEILYRFQQSIDVYNKRASRGYDISFCAGIVTAGGEQDSSIEVLMDKASSLMHENKQTQQYIGEILMSR